MVDWKAIDVTKIADYCQEYHARYTEYPSLRDIFYRFVDEFWPNTKSVYKTLSKWLRDKRLDKEIDWQIIRDGAGRQYEDNDWSYTTPRRHVELWLDLFTDVGSRYDLPRWLGQPKYVAVVTEKEADYPIIKSLVGLGSLNVDTAYARGYAGWKMLFQIAEKIKESKKQPIIIALADFDPSGGEKVKRGGKDLVSFLLNAMLKLGVEDVQVEKVLVTKEQIEMYKLPHRPQDESEIRKLRRDPRFKSWPYGLYRVETAALRAKAPDYFDKIIKEAVMKHFDKEINEKEKKKEKELRQKIEEFFDEQDDLINELRSAIRDSELLE